MKATDRDDLSAVRGITTAIAVLAFWVALKKSPH